jgi:Ca2+-binding RTX toxin-like protein
MADTVLDLNVKVVNGNGAVVRQGAVSASPNDAIQVNSVAGQRAGTGVDGGAGDDRIWGGAGDDKISGGDGNDQLDGGAGSDYLDGGAGDDRLLGGSGSDVMTGGDGNDYLLGGYDLETNYMFGGSGSDHLWGAAGDDLQVGGSGNDWLNGRGGDDIMFGDGELSMIVSATGALAGTPYSSYENLISETTASLTFNDRLNGGAGNDRMWGGRGADTFEYTLDNSEKSINFAATWGSDTIYDFNQGTGTLNETEGDKIDLRNLFSRLSELDVDRIRAIVNGNYINSDFEAVTDRGTATNADDLSVINATERGNVGSGFGNDNGDGIFYTMTGLSGENYVFRVIVDGTADSYAGSYKLQIGTQTTQTIRVGAVTKTVYGIKDMAQIELKGITKLDFDTAFLRETIKLVHGSEAADTMDLTTVAWAARAGTKSVAAYGFGGDDRMNGTARNDELNGGQGNDTVSGGLGDDRLWGEAGNNTLNGDDGNDILYGGAGTDILNGGNGGDRLYGGAGNDTMNGDAGNDTFYGGTGNDTMAGGAGNDRFVISGSTSVDWRNLKANFVFEAGHKVINDLAAGDKIQISGIGKDVSSAFISNWINTHVQKVGNSLIIDDNNADGVATGNWSVTIANTSITKEQIGNYFEWA